MHSLFSSSLAPRHRAATPQPQPCTRRAPPSHHHKKLPRHLTASAPFLVSLAMYATSFTRFCFSDCCTTTPGYQVALQEGEYGRGMMLTQPIQSGTSAAPGVACSVPLHLSLVLVKEKEMFSRGPLEWHERYDPGQRFDRVCCSVCTKVHCTQPLHTTPIGTCRTGSPT